MFVKRIHYKYFKTQQQLDVFVDKFITRKAYNLIVRHIGVDRRLMLAYSVHRG